jgi:LysM repeat protein
VRTSSLVVAGLLAATPLAAQQQPAAPAQDRVHVVQKGETLWDIARSYLSDPFLWPDIFRLNTAVVHDPALIYPRQQLVLPDGARVAAAEGGDRTVFYPVDTGARNRTLSIRAAGTADVPAVTVGDFYRASFVAAPAEVSPIGRVAAVEQATVAHIQADPQIAPYDRIFVALGQAGGLRIGDRMHFVRLGDQVPPFGRIYHSTGIGTVAAVDGGVATVVVTRLYDRMDVNDLALPAERFPVRAGVSPSEDRRGLDGRIVGFAEPHAVQTTEALAFLDVGRQGGIKEGDEFQAFKPATQMSWGRQPEIAVASLQVVRVMANTATVRVVALQQPALDLGLPVRRVARMP